MKPRDGRESGCTPGFVIAQQIRTSLTSAQFSSVRRPPGLFCQLADYCGKVGPDAAVEEGEEEEEKEEKKCADKREEPVHRKREEGARSRRRERRPIDKAST